MIGDKDINDLDETRRLLYCAPAEGQVERAGPGRKGELAGTLTNALLHHSKLETDANFVFDRLSDVFCVEPAGVEWAEQLIAKITDRISERRKSRNIAAIQANP